jgi:hypothetical protein
LIKNHALVDGNKRVAMATTALFLLMNGHLLIPSSEEMIRFAVEVAAGKPDMSWQDVARWLRRHTVPLTGSRAETIRLVAARFEEPREIIARLKERWSEIERFVAGYPA